MSMHDRIRGAMLEAAEHGEVVRIQLGRYVLNDLIWEISSSEISPLLSVMIDWAEAQDSLFYGVSVQGHPNPYAISVVTSLGEHQGLYVAVQVLDEWMLSRELGAGRDSQTVRFDEYADERETETCWVCEYRVAATAIGLCGECLEEKRKEVHD